MTQASTRQIAVDKDRLWADLMKIAEFTDKELPYTRRSFTPLFAEARSWLKEQFIAAGMTVRIDEAGNLIGRITGTTSGAGTITLGSHSDTVAGGGRFDGIAGVIASLEIARVFNQSNFKPHHNIEIVDFLAEEPNVFGLSCVGSRGMTGYLEPAMLDYSEPGGRTLAQAIDSVGGKATSIDQAKRSDVKAFFELHIEQGPVLEAEKIAIGVVTAIVGIRRIEVLFRGEADHAGTMPMQLRHDAAVAMAETIMHVRQHAEELSARGAGHFVATTGVVDVQPNAANVVPESARVVIDARAEQESLMEEFYKTLDVKTTEIAARYRVAREKLTALSNSQPSHCDPQLRQLLAACARDRSLSVRDMASGAGHDAAFLSKIAPAAMLFVPCLKGKSHASQEWAEPEALANGANTLLDAIIRFDSRL